VGRFCGKSLANDSQPRLDSVCRLPDSAGNKRLERPNG